jgi:hypothetical protein
VGWIVIILVNFFSWVRAHQILFTFSKSAIGLVLSLGSSYILCSLWFYISWYFVMRTCLKKLCTSFSLSIENQKEKKFVHRETKAVPISSYSGTHDQKKLSFLLFQNILFWTLTLLKFNIVWVWNGSFQKTEVLIEQILDLSKQQ